MSAQRLGTLSFNEFRKIISDELLVSEEKLVPQASFIQDLAVDSIQLVEMILRMEELGVKIPPEGAWQIQTVGDAYEYYVKNARLEPDSDFVRKFAAQ